MEKYLCNTTANSIYSLQAYEQPKEKKLIHYTSMEVMDILLDKCTFRASNVFYLNDAMEYKEGIDRLQAIASDKGKGVLEQIKDENGSGKLNRGVFSISFSQETDSLYQWITYAKETGVAIELDDDLIMDYHPLWHGIESYDAIADKDSNYDDLLFITLRVAMYPVIYEYEDTMQIDEMSADTKEKYMWYASFYKPRGFKAENEVRLSVFATENGDKHGEIKYFSMRDKGILRPYLNITFGHSIGEYPNVKFKPCLPLKSIMVGPSGIQQAAFDSVVHRIKYGKINVYEYVKDRGMLIKSFANYFKELSEWLTAKSYISNKSHTSINADTAADASKNTGLVSEILNHREVVKLAEKQLMSQLSKPVYCEVLIKQIISDWIDEYREYLLDIKDESGTALYDETYLWRSDDTNESQLDKILQEIRNDLYFSKEGVLIKKSKIPYIF